MRKVVITIFLIMVFCISTPVFADMRGEILSRIELHDSEKYGALWGVDLSYDFNKYFEVGVTLTCSTKGYVLVCEFLPSFHPFAQLYEIYGVINITPGLSIKLSQWCIHPVYTGADTQKEIWAGGLYLEGRYKF